MQVAPVPIIDSPAPIRQVFEGTTGVMAAGTGAGIANTPPELIPDLLLIHSLLGMSLANWISAISAIYIIVLLLKMAGVFKLAKWLINKAGSGAVAARIKQR